MPSSALWLQVLLAAQILAYALAQSPATAGPAPATAAPPLDPKLFEPTNRTSGLLYPNPTNPTCEVLLDIKTTNATAPQQQEPTASPVASSVQSNISLQIANLNSTAFATGFSVVVELPQGANITSVLNATLGTPTPGNNGTTLFPLTSAQVLPANGAASQILNTTVTSSTQDVTPRNVLLNNTRCALALDGLNAANQPNVGSPLFSNLQNPGGK